VLVVTTMRYRCAAKGCYLSERWDPSVLDGLLPRESSLINMDGWCEIGGRFLFVEFKHRFEPLSSGQHRALRRLAQLPGCTVVVLREQGDDQYRLTCLSDGTVVRGPIADIRDWIRAWGQAADASGLEEAS